MEPINDAWIKKQIKLDEGFVQTAYLDSLGYPTVGCGHMDKSLIVGKFYTTKQCEDWFEEDYKIATKDYTKLGLELDPLREGIMIMMLFNMGLGRVSGFKMMLGYLRSGDYEMAGVEGLKSKWHRQTKRRAQRMMAAMITGEWV